MITKLPITYEEGSDENSPPVAKLRGIALTPAEQIIAEKLQDVIDNLNGQEQIDQMLDMISSMNSPTELSDK